MSTQFDTPLFDHPRFDFFKNNPLSREISWARNSDKLSFKALFSCKSNRSELRITEQRTIIADLSQLLVTFLVTFTTIMLSFKHYLEETNEPLLYIVLILLALLSLYLWYLYFKPFYRLTFSRKKNVVKLGKKEVSLQGVRALQLLSYSDTTYMATIIGNEIFELHLIYDDGHQECIIAHCEGSIIKAIGTQISTFLEIPLWDTSSTFLTDIGGIHRIEEDLSIEQRRALMADKQYTSKALLLTSWLPSVKTSIDTVTQKNRVALAVKADLHIPRLLLLPTLPGALVFSYGVYRLLNQLDTIPRYISGKVIVSVELLEWIIENSASFWMISFGLLSLIACPYTIDTESFKVIFNKKKNRLIKAATKHSIREEKELTDITGVQLLRCREEDHDVISTGYQTSLVFND